jgi:hypothetical protein
VLVVVCLFIEARRISVHPIAAVAHPTEVSTFEPTPDFASANDLHVMRAVVAGLCAAPTSDYLVLSSTPTDTYDWRSLADSSAFPEGIQCNRLRLASYRDIEATFSPEQQRKAARLEPVYNGWEGFYGRFPGASGVLYLSLPVYLSEDSASVTWSAASCRLCGASFEVILRKVGATWRVVKRVPTGIS